MYGTRDNPARFPPPAITLPPPLPAHDDPWPRFTALQPVSPLVEPICAEAYHHEVDAYHRCTEAAAPVYTSTMSATTKLEETVTTRPFLAVVVNWLVSLAPAFSFEPLLPR
jgi:hypothetical protein